KGHGTDRFVARQSDYRAAPRSKTAASDRAQKWRIRMMTATVGRRGTVVVPAPLRKRFGIQEGGFVIFEEQDGVVVLRPATVIPADPLGTAEGEAALVAVGPERRSALERLAAQVHVLATRGS